MAAQKRTLAFITEKSPIVPSPSPSPPLAEEPAAKKQLLDRGNYSNKSLAMMERMGFKLDHGLGKAGQGRRDPIEMQQRLGRSGLGMTTTTTIKSTGDDTAKWLENEPIDYDCHPDWLYTSRGEVAPFDESDLSDWVRVGDRKTTIADEISYCDADVVAQLLQHKTVFDTVASNQIHAARLRSNPFETIGKSIFMNRAAVKMAEIDTICNNMFTNMLDENECSVVGDDQPLYFADVCAGPGGFSEYILWRKNWHAKGFGFTLRGDCDFRLNDFIAGHPEAFDTFYGDKDDGNVYDPDNITAFNNYVLRNTDGCGVHFMMSDGGFGVEGQENVQEILSKQLYLCQCLVSLCCVREGGHFVTKLFDTFTPFSVGLIYLMSKCFRQIAIVKPNSSRPANSERYLVCKWRLADIGVIRDHLFMVNDFMWHSRQSNDTKDVLELIPSEHLRADATFFEYICRSNNDLGRRQVRALMKLAAYCQNVSLRSDQLQCEVRAECLRTWRLPDLKRRIPQQMPVPQTFNQLMAGWCQQQQFITAVDHMLDERQRLPSIIADADAWHFVPVECVEEGGSALRAFFLSRGNGDLHHYNVLRRTWEHTVVAGVRFELPRNTLIYGELVKELSGEGKSQTAHTALHIIDAIMLGGQDVRSMPLQQRSMMIRKFAGVINKPGKIIDGSGLRLAAIRCKDMIPLRQLDTFFGSMEPRKLKDGNVRLGVTTSTSMADTVKFYVPRGLLMFNELKPNLRKHFDRNGRLYYCDLDMMAKGQRNSSFYPDDMADPNAIYASLKTTLGGRRLWKWELITQVQPDQSVATNSMVYRKDLVDFVRQ